MGWENIDWLTAVKRRHTPLFISALLEGQKKEFISRNTGYDFCFSNILKDGLRLAYDKAEITQARESIKKRWQENGVSVFQDFARVCLQSSQKCAAFIPTKGLNSFDEYSELMTNHASFLLTMIITQFELEDFMNTFVAERIKDGKEAQTIKEQLQVPLEQNHEVLNGIALLEIGKNIQHIEPDYKTFIKAESFDLLAQLPTKYPNVWNQIQDYKQEFAWMGRMYYEGDPIDELSIIQRLQNILQFDCTQKLKTIQERRAENLALRDKAIEALGGDQDAKDLADLISIYLHLRTFRLDAFFIAHENMIGFFEEFCSRYRLSYTEALYLTYEEIQALISWQEIQEEMRKLACDRQQAWSALVLEGQTEWFVGSVTGEDDVENSTKAHPSNEIKGVIANKGKVEGNVRIVLCEEDMVNMKQGEILVTTMTLPSLMLAVEKSSAIVTDEGGMLCHAAIVSREFNLPCVIATDVATRVFRTGHRVQVDADSGIVRKLQ